MASSFLCFCYSYKHCIGTSRTFSWRWRWHWRGRKAYYGDIAHLCSLLHAVALQHLRADSNLDNLEPLGVPRNGDTSGLLTEISWDQFADEYVAVCYSVLQIHWIRGLYIVFFVLIGWTHRLWIHVNISMWAMIFQPVMFDYRRLMHMFKRCSTSAIPPKTDYVVQTGKWHILWFSNMAGKLSRYTLMFFPIKASIYKGFPS
jgi:hypothetical protein